MEQISFLLSTFKYLVVILLDTRTVQGDGARTASKKVAQEAVEKLSFMGILLVALDLIFFVGSLVSLIAIVWLVKCELCNNKSRSPELLEQQKEENERMSDSLIQRMSDWIDGWSEANPIKTEDHL